MYIIVTILSIIFGVIIMDWHTRMVFMARVYLRKHHHGKTWKRAHMHYKSNWSLCQRLLWIPMFKEQYENKYKTLAYLSYFYVFVALTTIVCFLLNELVYKNVLFWHYSMIAFAITTILRAIYNNVIAKGM
jgi:hypothetical protein